MAQVSNALLTLQEQKPPELLQTMAVRSSPTKQVVALHNKPQPTPKKTERVYTVPPQIEETQVSLSFQQWLASVTERINQTMHYQFDGKVLLLLFLLLLLSNAFCFCFFFCVVLCVCVSRVLVHLCEKNTENFSEDFYVIISLGLAVFLSPSVSNLFHLLQTVLLR
jgi:hypothetical protein